VAAVQLGLSDTGYIVGQNLAVEHRWAEERNDRLPALAADLNRSGDAPMSAVGRP
jgi:putative ABC transport system substrate-binding protein